MTAEHVARWYADWCEPVVVALYRREPPEIHDSLACAYSMLETEDLHPEEAACLEYQLAYLEFQACVVLKQKEAINEKLEHTINRLSKFSRYTQAERLRRRLLLQLRINADRLRLINLEPDEFEQYFKAIPEVDHSTEFWLYVSGWAFRHDNCEYLEHAYEFAVLQAKGFHVAWTWQRVHMMLNLVRGTARREDMIWLIERLEILQQLKSIKRDIWPRAKVLGLVNEQLERRLLAREKELLLKGKDRVSDLLQPHLHRSIGEEQQNSGTAAG